MNPNKGSVVSVGDQGKISNLLKKFELREVKELKNNPKDLLYAAKLIEHYNMLQETGGHLVQRFQPNTPLSIDHYPRTKIFFDATGKFKEVLFRASNRYGKSEAGAYAAACWATGEYPEWWTGRVFPTQTYGWVAGDTNDTVRTILQDKLLGTPHGTGLIAKELIEDVVVRPNTGGTVDTIFVRHRPTKKISRIKFKTYQSGPDSFYGAAPNYVWMDEEPAGKDAQMIYNQCYIRLLTTNGNLIITFTPLMGWTPLLKDFTESATDLTPQDD